MLRQLVRNPGSRHVRLSGRKVASTFTVSSIATATLIANNYYSKHDNNNEEDFKQPWYTLLLPYPNHHSFVTQSEAAAMASSSSSDSNNTSSPSESSRATTVTIRRSATNTKSVISSERWFNLFVPTLEASARALNLVKTVVHIVLDYELYKYENDIASIKQRFIPSILSDSQLNENEDISHNDNDDNSKRKYWENQVQKRSTELEKAQADYTTKSPPDSYNERNTQELKRKVHDAAERLHAAEEELAKIGNSRKSAIHQKAAERILHLCRENGGVYIKVGQHLANLDYIIPEEYITVLSSLFDDTPMTPYQDVREVIREDLGGYPEELFESFEEEPIASASLAQVHEAREKGSGRKLAVKVQHRGLKETSKGDVFALTCVVGVVEAMFEEFTWGWIRDEIAPQLHKELDFCNEGKNSETAAKHIQESGIGCVVPKIHWPLTTARVLCMDFEEGFRATDLEAIRKAGLKTRDVAKLISSVFNSQVFQSGFVHCDPHPANVLLREENKKPVVVLVDHGLYKQIDDDFRLTYAKLWKSLMMADVRGIKTSCHELGVDEMYPLLAAMLTTRPFDEIIERSKSGSFVAKQKTGGDKAMIRGYAQRYIREIIDMLDAVPRQMLLLFKMNDCLRHIDHALGSCPTNTLVTAGEYAAKALYEEQCYKARWAERKDLSAVVTHVRHWFEYFSVLMRIRIHDIVTWWLQPRLSVV